MRYQLMEDIYGGKPDRRLTPEQREIIEAVKRPQLKEDIYLGITGAESIMPPDGKRVFPLREMD